MRGVVKKDGPTIKRAFDVSVAELLTLPATGFCRGMAMPYRARCQNQLASDTRGGPFGGTRLAGEKIARTLKSSRALFFPHLSYICARDSDSRIDSSVCLSYSPAMRRVTRGNQDSAWRGTRGAS